MPRDLGQIDAAHEGQHNGRAEGGLFFDSGDIGMGEGFLPKGLIQSGATIAGRPAAVIDLDQKAARPPGLTQVNPCACWMG